MTAGRALSALIIGASRGIGFELVRQYRADGAAVSATARDEAGLARLREAGAQALTLDVTDAQGLARFGGELKGLSFDVVLVNAGVLGPRSTGQEPPTQAEFDLVMHTNVLAAMRLLPLLTGVLADDARLAVISSRMGSIGERSSNSAWLYRASKAALNSVLKDAAIALEGKARCVAFHPGWVRTDMGGAGADLDVADSVAGIRRTLVGLERADNGVFLNYDGTPISW